MPDWMPTLLITAALLALMLYAIWRKPPPRAGADDSAGDAGGDDDALVLARLGDPALAGLRAPLADASALADGSLSRDITPPADPAPQSDAP